MGGKGKTENIDRNVIEQIKQQVDIIGYIGSKVKLSRRGHEYVGLCPFHKEKTPSFTLNPEKGVFFCFGCKAGGDVIAFAMEYEGASFTEAVEILAAEAGLEVTSSSGDSDFRKLKLNSEIMMLFKKQKSEVAKFLLSRSIDMQTCDRFHVGYSPPGGSGLMGKFPMDIDILDELGLLKRDDGGHYYERFENRIIFPIIHNRHPIAFGGRTMDSESKRAKYVNSPTSSLYDKSRSLYGLAQAKKYIRETGRAYVVEGYTDVLSFWTAGIKNVVASCGTAFTKYHAKILSGMAGSIVFVMDSDNAGRKAAYSASIIALRYGVIPGIMHLPDNHDPNSLLQEKGPEELASEVSKWLPFYKYYSKLLEKYPADKKIKFIKEAIAAANSIIDGVTRSVVLNEIKKHFDVNEQFVNRQRALSARTYEEQAVPHIVDEEVRADFLSKIRLSDFDNHVEIFKYAINEAQHGRYHGLQDLMRKFPDDYDFLLASGYPPPKVTRKSGDALAARLLERAVDRRLDSLNKDISKRLSAGEDVTEMEKEYENLRMRKALMQRMSKSPPW